MNLTKFSFNHLALPLRLYHITPRIKVKITLMPSTIMSSITFGEVKPFGGFMLILATNILVNEKKEIENR